MAKFFNKFKKPCFWPSFGPFFQFLGLKFFQKIRLRHANLHMVFYKIKLQINSNRRKFQIAIGGKGGRTARAYFIGPFRLPPRVQLYQFHYCRIYLADFSEGRPFCPSSPSMSSPKRPILNRVNKGIINISRT